ncbi:MAG: hypothetical protein GF350_15215 [Chitinivibrionales bacterium]|nr:hypothetical protein [Chitinivibrionales bacterium]
MAKHIIWYPFIGIACMVFAQTGCSSHAAYRSTLLYQSDDFDGGDFAHNTVMILPVIYENGFDTSANRSPTIQAEWLMKQRPDLSFTFKEKFESRYRSAYGFSGLNQFYRALYNGDVVAAQTSDSIWTAMEADFLLVTAIKSGAIIKDFDRNTKKRIRCETELWDIQNSEVVWRAATVGSSVNGTNSTGDFILGALFETYKSIPAFKPAMNEKNW